MELSVLWTDTAKFQLKGIYNYHKKKANKTIAKKLVKSIIERTIQLAKNPNSGPKEQIPSEKNFDYRYLVEGNYKIIYWIQDVNVTIAMVFDCRQNPEKIKSL